METNLEDLDVLIVVEKANIILCGATGHGKSELINGVAGKVVAKTSKVEPCTMNMEQYEVDDVTYFDTRGLEMKEYKTILETLERFILSRNGETDSNRHIHIAYLVISEQVKKIEAAQKSLKEFFDKMKVPVVVVLTHAFKDEEEAEFYQIVVGEFPGTRVVRVNSREEKFGKNVLPVSGLEELIKVTCSMIPDVQQRAVLAAQAISEEMKMIACKKIIAIYATLAASASTVPFVGLALWMPFFYGMIISIGDVLGFRIGKPEVLLLLGVINGVGIAGGVTALIADELLDLIPVIGWIDSGVLSAAAVSTFMALFGLSFAKQLLIGWRERLTFVQVSENFKANWKESKKINLEEAKRLLKK